MFGTQARVILGMLAVVWMGQGVAAQPLTFEVQAVTMDDTDQASQRAVMASLGALLEARGAQEDDRGQWIFLVGLSAPNANQEVALSVTTLYRIPEKVVQVGKREQVFYKTIAEQDGETYPASGTWVREHMSEAYMRQFAMVQGNDVRLVPLAEVDAALSDILDRFYGLHVRR